jgi:hypothetical protein
MDTKVVHCAGPALSWPYKDGMRGLQRCVICGEKLMDTWNQAVVQDGEERQIPCWEEGVLVEIESFGDGCTRERALTKEETDQFPRDPSFKVPHLCIDLVEE